MKIAVYAICLNEEHHVEGFVRSAADADLIQVADTGSTDGTVAALEALGAIVRPIRIEPWRFDDARNASLAMLPGDVDICICLDLDNRLNPGWRAALEAAWTPGTNRAYFNSIIDRRPDGSPRQHLDNRIHGRHGVRWKSPCHEYLAPDRTPEQAVWVSGLVMEQIPEKKARRKGYLPLLELAARESPYDARSAHFLGRELKTLGRFEEAKAEFERYLTLPTTEVLERNATWRMLAMTHLALDDRASALACFRAATDEGPQVRGAWIDLACALYQAQDWLGCLAACVTAMGLPDTDTEYGAQSDSNALPEDMASVSAWRLGRSAEAIAHARRAVERAPGVERLRANLAAMESAFGGAS